MHRTTQAPPPQVHSHALRQRRRSGHGPGRIRAAVVAKTKMSSSMAPGVPVSSERSRAATGWDGSFCTECHPLGTTTVG
jgi:hypothetical protein